jgi:hypothetical protein
MKFGNWLFEKDDVVKKALALDDPPSKFDDDYELISLEEIKDNIDALESAESIIEKEVNAETDEEEKKWKTATYRDIKDSLGRWKKFEENRLAPPEEKKEKEASPEEKEEAPPEKKEKEAPPEKKEEK